LKHKASLVVGGVLPDVFKKQFDEFVKDLGVKDLNVQVNEVKTTSIKRGSKCSSCGKEIGKDEISYESFATKEGTDGESEVTACEKCEEKFKDKHLFFYVPKNGAVTGLRMGRDKFKFAARKEEASSSEEAAAEDKKEVHRGYYCDGCGGAIPGIRWKCAHCDDWDYCENCMTTKTHPVASHVFVKVDYPGKMVYFQG